MASILGEYHRYCGRSDLPTAEQFDVTYANLTNCDTATDIVLIEAGSEPVGYVRTSWEQLDNDARDYCLFSPMRPAHIRRATVRSARRRPGSPPATHGRRRGGRAVSGVRAAPRTQAWNSTNESAWLESLGYEASAIRRIAGAT